MRLEPIIFVISPADSPLEKQLRSRYGEGYRIIVGRPQPDLLAAVADAPEERPRCCLFIYEQTEADEQAGALLAEVRRLWPDSGRLLIVNEADRATAVDLLNRGLIERYLVAPCLPLEARLYPAVDELLAEWRASVDAPFMRVKGIMTVRSVRIRLGDSLQRAAEIIALSGVGDLMVIDEDNGFRGVLSVGDVLRAAMPDIEEILEEGGTMEQAFRLFLRKGSELMYKPIEPLVIANPLTVDPEDHVAKVAALMLEKNIHRLPVVKDGRLVGTVGRADICQAVVGTL